ALGFNSRMDEPRAALAARRLRRLDADNDARRELDARYRHAFGELGVTCALPAVDRLASAHHLFAIVLDEGADRDAFRAAVADRGIQTSLHYTPVHRFAIYAAEGDAVPATAPYGACGGR